MLLVLVVVDDNRVVEKEIAHFVLVVVVYNRVDKEIAHWVVVVADYNTLIAIDKEFAQLVLVVVVIDCYLKTFRYHGHWDLSCYLVLLQYYLADSEHLHYLPAFSCISCCIPRATS